MAALPPRAENAKVTRKVIAAVAMAALVAVAAGVVLSETRAAGGQELLAPYSAKQSDKDMSSYFDSLSGKSSSARHTARKEHAALAKALEAKHAKIANQVDADGLPILNAKHHGKHTKASQAKPARLTNKVGADGLPILNANHHAKHHAKHHTKHHTKHDGKHAKTLDAEPTKIAKQVGADGLPLLNKAKKLSDKPLTAEHKRNQDELRDYKLENPTFAAEMQKVHTDWISRHDGLPTSKADKTEYAKLVAKEVGNIAQIVDKGTTKTFAPGMIHEKAHSWAWNEKSHSWDDAIVQKQLSKKNKVMVGKAPVQHTARK